MSNNPKSLHSIFGIVSDAFKHATKEVAEEVKSIDLNLTIGDSLEVNIKPKNKAKTEAQEGKKNA